MCIRDGVNRTSAAVPGGWWGRIVLIAAAVALIAVIGYWVRPARRRPAAGPLLQKVSSRTAGRVLLVGDAAGYVDALTGEGLGIAFGGAALLVECVTADRPQDYDRRWRGMSRRYRLLTAGVLRAIMRQAENGLELLGSVHSHPDWHEIGPQHERRLRRSENPTRMDEYLFRESRWPVNVIWYVSGGDGGMILDSRSLYGKGDVLRFELPPPSTEKPGFVERATISIRTWLNRGDLPLYRELGPENGNGYQEVAESLKGQKRSMVRVNDRGEVIVSVAVPVQRFRAIHGALMLSTQGDDIDQMVTAERLAILKVGGVASAVMIMLSLLLASTIAGPVRRLADSAERVRRRIRTRVEIPDFTRRRDEIGHLSGALRDMTDALYNRIEAIEMFAADVAHELKNPLTSLRSAVETLPLARNENSRSRLLAVIEHDVKRLDRLISDISDASRLDAELQRQDMAPVDLRRLLGTLTTVANETKLGHDVGVQIRFEGRSAADIFSVPGHDSRLGQVISNLLVNAQSFSNAGGKVRIVCRRVRSEIEIVVDDDGPGIREDALERIFERFYTDRPHQGFGQNSGLGLSISKQIIEAHGGRIWAENRAGPLSADGEATITGARFVVRLPAQCLLTA